MSEQNQKPMQNQGLNNNNQQPNFNPKATVIIPVVNCHDTAENLQKKK